MSLSEPFSPKPRVLQVITHLDMGGAERVCFGIMQGLSSDISFSVYAVRGVAPGSFGENLIEQCNDLGARLYTGPRFPVKYGGLLVSAAKLGTVIERAKPDIIHLHTEIPEAAYAISSVLRPNMMRSIALVRTIHNSVYWTPWRWLGLWSERHMRSATIIGVSAAALHAFEELKSEAGGGPAARPPQVIFNGVKVNSTRRNGDPLPRDQARVKVLFAGRFEYQKGVDLLGRALAAVGPLNGSKYELTLCGQGRLENVVAELASNPPYGWTVKVLAPVPSIEPLLWETDVVIMPSRFEGFGLLAVESLSAGVPVIATDAPGLREVFPPGYPWLAKSGCAADFGAILRQALHQPDGWKSVVREAQDDVICRFDIRRMCEEYRQVYLRELAQ